VIKYDNGFAVTATEKVKLGEKEQEVQTKRVFEDGVAMASFVMAKLGIQQEQPRG
jgi:hypothetical protein